MDRLRKRFLFCLVPVILYGCQSEKQLISRLWFYTYNAGPVDPQDTLITPASFLDLRQDGSYTMDFNGFDAGTWEFSKKQLILTDDRKQRTILPVSYVSEKNLQVSIPRKYFDFEGFSNASMTTAEDPFSRENNRWRLPSAAKETDQQIIARLVNHFQFWQTYFRWALTHGIQYVDVRSTPTPIKIYGNGFGLKPFDQLPAKWKAYFYDEEDCRKANDKIKVLFDNNSIAWPQTDNKYKMFISAFQQLQQKI